MDPRKFSRRVAGLTVSHVESEAENALRICFTDGSSLATDGPLLCLVGQSERMFIGSGVGVLHELDQPIVLSV